MWFFLALFTSVATALKDVLAKKSTEKFNPFIVTWAWVTFSLLFLLPVLLFTTIPQLNTVFWIALAINLLLNFISILMYVKAVELSPLSLTIPMLAFSPFFILITSFLINGELPNKIGVLGVLLIPIGTYLLNFDYSTKKILSPFRAIWKEKGVLLMLGVAFIWGTSSSIDKFAINNSNPLFYTVIAATTLALFATPIAYFSSRQQFRSVFQKQHLKILVPIGILDGAATLAQMIATSMTYVVFVIAIKRLSILFAAILGWYFFREKIRERIAPIMIIFIGIILIAFS